MPIYTRTGDSGETGIIGGKRIPKSDPQVEAYGSVDELSSHLGLLALNVSRNRDSEYITGIQKDLYHIMSFLAGSPDITLPLDEKIRDFENVINTLEKQLPKLSRFIVPQGTQISAYAHIARTVCRRAERNIVSYAQTLETPDNRLQSVIRYLNRLSDLLFMLSRKYNKAHEETV